MYHSQARTYEQCVSAVLCNRCAAGSSTLSGEWCVCVGVSMCKHILLYNKTVDGWSMFESLCKALFIHTCMDWLQRQEIASIHANHFLFKQRKKNSVQHTHFGVFHMVLDESSTSWWSEGARHAHNIRRVLKTERTWVCVHVCDISQVNGYRFWTENLYIIHEFNTPSLYQQSSKISIVLGYIKVREFVSVSSKYRMNFYCTTCFFTLSNTISQSSLLNIILVIWYDNL